MMIINQTSEDGNNYFHTLINKLTEDNHDEVAEMIKVMIANKCNANCPNDKQETPLLLLLNKLKTGGIKSDLPNLFLEKSNSDKNDELLGLLEQFNLEHKPVPAEEAIRSVEFMNQLLEEWNEKKFVAEFESFKQLSQATKEWQSDLTKLLVSAVARNFVRAASLILSSGANVNGVPINTKYQTAPAFVACYFGHSEVLKLILDDPMMDFMSDDRSLLHQICYPMKMHENDRQKCFDLIISHPRCTTKIINVKDDDAHLALYYACLHGFDEIAKELLRRGASLGHDSVIGNISKNVLKDFLDERIKCAGDTSDKNCEIFIDYRFLMPTNVHEELHLENRTVYLIVNNSKLKELSSHPVISLFLNLKWKKISWLAYINLSIYLSFLLFLGNFIIYFYDDRYSLTGRGVFGIISLLFGIQTDDLLFDIYIKKNILSYRICAIGVVLISTYEIIQCVSSYKKYFLKLSNWLDMTFICLVCFVFFGSSGLETKDFNKFRAITILVMAAQSFELVAKVSAFSMSMHMAIFKRVSAKFLKTIVLYMILVLAFAMSFYTLNFEQNFQYQTGKTDKPSSSEDDEDGGKVNNEKSFSNPFTSLITTVQIMFTRYDKVKIKSGDYFQAFMLILFVVLIGILLFNLPKSLAIGDTTEIQKEVELVDASKKVSILNLYEKIFVFLKLSFTNIFPEASSILITPNQKIHIRPNIEAPLNVDVGIVIDDDKKEMQKRTLKIKFLNKHMTLKISSSDLKKILEFIEAQKPKPEKEEKIVPPTDAVTSSIIAAASAAAVTAVLASKEKQE